MIFEKELQSKSGKSISILVSESSNKPKLVLVEIHGGIEGSKKSVLKDNQSLVDWANQRLINYISVDLSNNGSQKNQPVNKVLFSDRVKDIETVSEYVQENYYSPIVLIGSSMGGLVAINAAKQLDSVKGLILNCPAVKAHETVKSMIKSSEFMNWEQQGVATWLDQELPYKFYLDLVELNGLKLLPNIKIPILWFHGTVDPIVPIKQAYEAKVLKPDIELIEIEGGGHRFGDKMKPGEWLQKVERFIDSIT